jgi:hypothetical protein
MVSLLGVCVICSGFVLLGRDARRAYARQEAVSQQMADAIATSVTGSIAATTGSRTVIVIEQADFNVNNSIAKGESGIRSGTRGTFIYGLETGFSGRGITLYMADEAVYSGIPTVADGQIDLIENSIPSSVLKSLLTKSGFERAMENGINRALSDAGLVPVALMIWNGDLSILTAPGPSATSWVYSNSTAN